ncbi:MAG: efflux RND transporter periplasmic adaptor subunit [Candidatus Xenobia bacterium]
MKYGWLATLVALLVGTGLGWWLSGERREAPHPTAAPSPSPGAGPPQLVLDAKTRQALGIRLSRLGPWEKPPGISWPGVVSYDPAWMRTVTAPLSGQFEASRWPRPGDRLQAGTPLGQVVPLPSVSDRIALATRRLDLASRVLSTRQDLHNVQSRLLAAESAVHTSQLEVTARAAEAHRLAILNGEDKNVSDQALRQGQLALQQARSALEQNRQTWRSLSSQAATDRATLSLLAVPIDPVLQGAPVVAPADGVVTTLGASSGQAVTQGQTLLSTAQPDRMLVAVTLPLGLSAPPPRQVSVHTRAARFVREEPAPAGVGVRLIYRLHDRVPPGEPITVQVAGSGPPVLKLPAGALLRTAGQLWVFRAEEDALIQTPVEGGEAAPDGWWVRQGFSPGEGVVSRGVETVWAALQHQQSPPPASREEEDGD